MNDRATWLANKPELTDGFGRSIDTLRLSVTDLCNERCVYCMPEGGVNKRGHEDMLSLEELAEIAEAAVACGISKIRLTGGEPLVRRGVVELCEKIGALAGLGELCMTTNGLLLPPVADELRRAGIARVNLSLDSLRPERYAAITRRGTLAQALHGLHSALSAGFRQVKLNMVLMGGVNDDEIGDFIDLTKDAPIEVRFLELMPMGECACWPSSRFVSAAEVLRRFPALEPLEQAGVAQRYRMPGPSGRRRPDPSAERMLLRRMRPYPHHAGRHAQALLAFGYRAASARAAWGSAARGHSCGVALKPMRHELERGGSRAERRMNEIGG